MKLAKVEAEKEIEASRAQQEQAFAAANTQADDSEETKRIQDSADKDIAALAQQFAAGKGAVIDLMIESATSVDFTVPDARKNKKR